MADRMVVIAVSLLLLMVMGALLVWRHRERVRQRVPRGRAGVELGFNARDSKIRQPHPFAPADDLLLARRRRLLPLRHRNASE